MSVQSEIQRLQTAKENILTAIASKNIVVPPGTTLDGAANLIKAIENANTNNLMWQEILNGSEYGGISPYTDNLKCLSWSNIGLLVSQDGINYDVIPCFAYDCIATLGNIIINTGISFGPTYHISFDGGNSWEFDVLPEVFEEYAAIHNCFSFDQKIFIVIDGVIFFSYNGIDWIQSKNGDFGAMAYATSQQSIVVLAHNKEAYYSTDGDTWISIDIQLDENTFFENVIYDGDRYFLLCNDEFYHSTDLITWKKERVPESGAITDIMRYTFSTGSYGWVLSSYNGIYWCTDIDTEDTNHSWLKYHTGTIYAIASRKGRALALGGLDDGRMVLWMSYNIGEWYECTPTNLSDFNGWSLMSSDMLRCDGTAFYVIGSGFLKAY